MMQQDGGRGGGKEDKDEEGAADHVDSPTLRRDSEVRRIGGGGGSRGDILPVYSPCAPRGRGDNNPRGQTLSPAHCSRHSRRIATLFRVSRTFSSSSRT